MLTLHAKYVQAKACSKTLTTGTTEHSRNSAGITNTLIGGFLRKSGSSLFSEKTLSKFPLFRLCSVVPVVSVLLHAPSEWPLLFIRLNRPKAIGFGHVVKH